mmetsp:Transcript_43027/g.47879  ORF Transcript_43027/g.47879 Transcript_43027/m.47879 type:complete len:88 (-) Transcript_43027:271-534(-)
MDTIINDVLTTNDKDGYLVAVPDGSVKHMHQLSFGWALSMVKGGLYLAKSFGECNGRGSSLIVETVGMLSIWIFTALMAKHRKCTEI